MTAETQTRAPLPLPSAVTVPQTKQAFSTAELTFPPDFVLGVGDSDLQVIGTERATQDEGSELTEWDVWAQEFHGDNIPYHKHGPKRGIDRYTRWEEDARLIHDFGIENYRTSVSMSRTLTRSGEVNGKALEWYRNYFKALRAFGIHLYITLYHWELPAYLADKGGWKNLDTADHLVKHSKLVAEYLGEFIEEYCILNEPWVSAMLAYHWGLNPPGEKDLGSALQVAHNLLLAQGMVFETLKAKDSQMKISTGLNVEPAYANTTDARDIAAAHRYDGYFNRWFLDPLFKGEYPADMVEFYEAKKKMPLVSKGDMQQIRIGPRLHRLGINYYRGATLEHFDGHVDPDRKQVEIDLNLKYSPVKEGALTDSAGGAIYLPPHYRPGLYDFLQQAHRAYKDYGLGRIYITENGIALNTQWDGRSEVIDDERRIFYLQEHLRQVHEAVRDGINVQGYFAWTLMDNYEWGGGYDDNKRYGLVYIERETLERIPKSSAFWYGQVCRSRRLNELQLKATKGLQMDTTKDPSGFLLAEYNALRGEILTRTEIQHQLISIVLVAFGALISVGFQNSPTAMLAYPMLTLFLSAVWSYNDIQIRQLATYIRDRLEDRLLGDKLGWEHRPGSDTDSVSKLIGERTIFATRVMLFGTQLLAMGLYVVKTSSLNQGDAVLLVLDLIAAVATFVLLWRNQVPSDYSLALAGETKTASQLDAEPERSRG